MKLNVGNFLKEKIGFQKLSNRQTILTEKPKPTKQTTERQLMWHAEGYGSLSHCFTQGQRVFFFFWGGGGGRKNGNFIKTERKNFG